MEERDIQVRGYALRLPLDVLLVASANPEDYTNRGRIITPLKDRFGAEIRTHYPLELDDEIAVIRPGGRPGRRRCPTTCWRSSPGSPGRCASRSAVDQRSGVSARFAIAARRDRRRGRAAPRRRCTGESRTRSPGRSTSSRCPTCCAASSSSPPARRAARPSSSSTCCAAPPPTPPAPGCAASTSPPLAEAVSAVPGAHGGAGARRRGGGRPAHRATRRGRAHRGGQTARRGGHRGARADGQRGRARPGAAVPHPASSPRTRATTTRSRYG